MGSVSEVSVAEVLCFYSAMESLGIPIWLDGGWCVDALLGKQTRPHGDLDIAIEQKHVSRARSWLTDRAYREVKRDSAWNFEMEDGAGRRIDFHAFVVDRNGKLVGGTKYPDGSLSGLGVLENKVVRCIVPEVMIRLHTGYDPRDTDVRDVLALCEKYGIDVPAEYEQYQSGGGTEHANAKVRGLVVFDLDGTLLCGRTVCELLAEPLGKAVEMQRFEALSSELDVAESRVEMASWYRGIAVEDLCRPLERATWRPGVSASVALLRAARIEVAIASITWRIAVEWFAEKIGVSHVLGTAFEPGGTIRHVWPHDKGTYVRALSEKLGVQPQRIAAVGDSMNDQHLLSAASLRFFVGDGPPPLVSSLRHRPDGDILAIAQEVVDSWVVAGKGATEGNPGQ